MRLILTIAALPFIAACAQPITLVCDREAIPYDKWGEVAELPELCQPPVTSPRPLVRPVVHDSDDNDPQPPTVTPPPSKPPVSDPPEDKPPEDKPDEPKTPDAPDRVKGDNSDANGRGGNHHDRNDFTHGGTETAENKKESRN